MTKAESFFYKVICDYNCGDVESLLADETSALGPLLSAVSAGVDTAAGMMFGFTDSNGRGNSEERSVRFLRDIVKFDGVTAEAIYSCVRCGYMHEGIGKLNVSWFADYKRVKPGVVFFRRRDGKLALSVVELAHKYLDGIGYVWKDCRGQLQHLPAASNQDERVVSSLLASVLPGLEDFDAIFSDMRGSSAQDDILEEVTYWEYDGYEQDEPDT